MLDNENIGSASGQQENVSDSTISNEAPQAAPSFNPADYVPKARVEELIHSRTKEATERAVEKTRAEMAQKQGVGMGGMSQVDDRRIGELVDQRLQQLRQDSERKSHEQRVNDLTNDYIGKLQSQDPELLKREQEIGEMFSLIPYINETGEAAAITKHLLDNEGAYANLMVLSHTAPARVRSAIKKIEASIKTNKEALSREYPNEPLSQPNPSVTTADAGSNSIEALKQQPWLRG
jgi:hypothetical protein